jgi:hypothetical protein
MACNVSVFLLTFNLISVISNAQNLKSAENSFVVIELFTSEGCSSCPPADKVLSEVIADARKNKKPIYAMSFHVDYWNRLGWKDPYSNVKYTFRQNNYTDAMGELEVYTPQVFVNGKTSFVGSDKKRLLSEIGNEIKIPSACQLKLMKSDSSTADTLIINYVASKTDKNYTLYIALVQRGLLSKVGRGENSGKTLTHDNVVRAFENTDLLFPNGSMKIPVNKFTLNQNFSIYGYVQQKQTKKILAATGFDL